MVWFVADGAFLAECRTFRLLMFRATIGAMKGFRFGVFASFPSLGASFLSLDSDLKGIDGV